MTEIYTAINELHIAMAQPLLTSFNQEILALLRKDMVQEILPLIRKEIILVVQEEISPVIENGMVAELISITPPLTGVEFEAIGLNIGHICAGLGTICAGLGTIGLNIGHICAGLGYQAITTAIYIGATAGKILDYIPLSLFDNMFTSIIHIKSHTSNIDLLSNVKNIRLTSGVGVSDAHDLYIKCLKSGLKAFITNIENPKVDINIKIRIFTDLITIKTTTFLDFINTLCTLKDSANIYTIDLVNSTQDLISFTLVYTRDLINSSLDLINFTQPCIKDLIFSTITSTDNIYIHGDVNVITKTGTDILTKPVQDTSKGSNKRKEREETPPNLTGKNPIPITDAKRQRIQQQTNINIQYLDTRNSNNNVGVVLLDTLDATCSNLRHLYRLGPNRFVQINRNGTLWTCIRFNPSANLLNRIGQNVIFTQVNVIHTSNGQNNGSHIGMWISPRPFGFVIRTFNYYVTSGNLPLMYNNAYEAVFIFA